MSFERTLSEERARRLRSLSNVRALYLGSPDSLREAGGQAMVVMCYAHWEGYFNFCVDRYIDYVNSLNKALVDINPALLACEIEPHINSLKDRNFRRELRPEFARNVVGLMECKSISQNQSLLKAASNLNFGRLQSCLNALDISDKEFFQHRNFIVHELVKWRHQVAHGDDPRLDTADLIAHSHKTEDLLLLMKESFEDRVSTF